MRDRRWPVARLTAGEVVTAAALTRIRALAEEAVALDEWTEGLVELAQDGVDQA